jgi:hypothetical protein
MGYAESTLLLLRVGGEVYSVTGLLLTCWTEGGFFLPFNLASTNDNIRCKSEVGGRVGVAIGCGGGVGAARTGGGYTT